MLAATGKFGDVVTYEASTSRVLISVVAIVVLVTFNAIFLMAYHRSPDTRHKSSVTGLSWLAVGVIFFGLVWITGRPLPTINEEAAEEQLSKKYDFDDVRLVNDHWKPKAAIADEPTEDSPEFIGKHVVRHKGAADTSVDDYSDAYDYMEVRFRATFTQDGKGVTKIKIIDPAGMKPGDLD